MEHWHVRTHADDEDVYATATRMYALDYAADRLDEISDREHEDITLRGEEKDYESAYNAFVASGTYATLAANLHAMVRNACAVPDARAPLYRDESQCGPLWRKAADAVETDVNTNSPFGFAIWSCSLDECEPGEWIVSTEDAVETDAHFDRGEFDSAWNTLVDRMPDASSHATVTRERLPLYPDPDNYRFVINGNLFSITWTPEESEV